MERIAIISDIHGNLEALKTVLNDIEKRNITTIYCLGDIIAKGVNSSECLELVRSKCQLVLLGNCDEFFSKEQNLEGKEEISKKRFIYNHQQLTEEQRQYLLNLPFSHEFYMSGSLIRLFHATPEKIDGFIASIDSLEQKRLLFLPSENTPSKEIADIVIYGHTHIQYLDRLYNKTLINVGSVGNSTDTLRNKNFDSSSMETTQAFYLILEGNMNSKVYDASLSYQFIRIPYNIEKELNTDKENPEKEGYKTELIEGKPRDQKRIIESFKERNIDINKI